MKEGMRGFFGEFYSSWGWRVCKGVLVIVACLLTLLYTSSLVFDDSSMYFLKNKHEYTFKIVEIAVSIFAFVGLIWSITYQREELLQSRKELKQSREDLKAQSENVNRSIDETNKNFDRELLLEFYRKIDKELSSGDLALLHTISSTDDPTSVLMDYNLELIQTPDIRLALLNFISGVDNYLQARPGRRLPSREWVANREFKGNEGLKLRYQVDNYLSKIEQEVLFILHDMLRYSNKKDISFDEPVFSLLKSTLRSSHFFEERKDGYKLTLNGVRGALINVGIIEQSENSNIFIGDEEFERFLSALCELNAVKDINDFRDYILGVGEYS